MTATGTDIPNIPPPETHLTQLDSQLSNIITSAKQIAIIAEELLREFSALDQGRTNEAMTPARLRQTIQAAAVAPRLLAATQQQLESLNAMLRME